MTIAADIQQQARPSAEKQTAKYQVVDTVVNYWREVQQWIQHAAIVDATPMVESFSRVSRFTTQFERTDEYRYLEPVSQQMWVEAAVEQLPGRIAMLIHYSRITTGDLSEQQARLYGFRGLLTWACRIRCFAKLRFHETIPLRWEWLEYIGQDGRSAGSAMAPSPVPEYFSRMTGSTMPGLDYLQSSVCAFAANLSLYAVDKMNSENKKKHPERASQ